MDRELVVVVRPATYSRLRKLALATEAPRLQEPLLLATVAAAIVRDADDGSSCLALFDLVTGPAMEVVFDPFDAVRSEEADELLGELRDTGIQADVTLTETKGVLETVAIVALVTVATTTVVGLSTVVVFLHRAFGVGVVVDASKDHVRVRKDSTLPRGSVLTIPRGGEPVLSYNVSGDDLRTLMSSVLRGSESRSE